VRLRDAIARCVAADRVHVLLDYDGTLVPLERTPELAEPDPALTGLVAELAASPRLDVHVVSGRGRADLGRWFGRFHVSLWAEHGCWHRPAGLRPWRAVLPFSNAWMPAILPVLDDFVRRTPGAWVERKSASLAWHYRLAPPGVGSARAHELRARLDPQLGPLELEVLEGHEVVEIRRTGTSKAVVARWLADHDPGRHPVIAFGDDLTDDELFAALPADAVTISVRRVSPYARFRVRNPRDVRRVLARLLP
jgi:trehalose 6-phosphate synthase/phosphatase